MLSANPEQICLTQHISFNVCLPFPLVEDGSKYRSQYGTPHFILQINRHIDIHIVTVLGIHNRLITRTLYKLLNNWCWRSEGLRVACASCRSLRTGVLAVGIESLPSCESCCSQPTFVGRTSDVAIDADIGSRRWRIANLCHNWSWGTHWPGWLRSWLQDW